MPHFFSPDFSSGGTPDAYRKRRYEKRGEMKTMDLYGDGGREGRARRAGPNWSENSPR